MGEVKIKNKNSISLAMRDSWIAAYIRDLIVQMACLFIRTFYGQG